MIASSDALSPWILNTITDHKTRFILYPKWVCLFITQAWSMYCNIMSVFAIFLAMSQIDFVLIRMLADLRVLVNAYTTTKFMHNKTYCQKRAIAEIEVELGTGMTVPADTTPMRKEEIVEDSVV